MGPEAFVTVLGVAVIVAALAADLIIIAGILVKVSSNLSRILDEVIIDIAQKTGNVGSVVSSIAGDVTNIERSLASVAAARGSGDGRAQEPEEEEEEVEEAEAADYTEAEYVEEEEEYVEERPRRRRRARAARR